MKMRVQPGGLSGTIRIPGSKSHTIRGLIIGMLADGESSLRSPLVSNDTMSCLRACEALGAEIRTQSDDVWRIHGTGGRPTAPDAPIDVGNSGTTLYLGLTAAALAEGETRFTGDEQIQRRSAGPLLQALRQLGAEARSETGDGCPPLTVRGPLHGGHAEIECPTSQYLSSLLIGCPLAEDDTTIHLPLLNEKPYVSMTLQWLDELGIRYEADEELSHFEIPGSQSYPTFTREIPGDFSSATFFLVAAAVGGSRLTLTRLDMEDVQGDKAVVGMLEEMGCVVSHEATSVIIEGPGRLEGATFDLNATPDALPAMAVAGAVADGSTRLVNVPQAREKETDRIAVMATELSKMGAQMEELPDGLVIQGGRLHGAVLDGHGDHRVVMALAVAGLVAEGETTIGSAESVAVTFPEFCRLLRHAGGDICVEQ